MLNGKFYTGLPPEMVDKKMNCNNRQKTNFFWPNDSELESVNKPKVKTNLVRNNTIHLKVNESPEILSKKQLASSITFYDSASSNDNQPSTKNLREKVVNTPINTMECKDKIDFHAKNAEIFCSKIQFYDYIDDLKNSPKTDNNSKNKNENIKNSPKSLEKNSIEDDTPFRKMHNFNLKQKQAISKSTDNIPQIRIKMEDKKNINLNKIENDVRNLFLINKINEDDDKNNQLRYKLIDETKIIDQPKPFPNHYITKELQNVSLDKEQKQIHSAYKLKEKPNNAVYVSQEPEINKLRHLESNFSVGKPSEINDRLGSKKIRSSAFKRVTVGLPD